MAEISTLSRRRVALDDVAALPEHGHAGSCSSCSLHDAVTAEQRGIPEVGVVTEKFVSAAELMSRVLGADRHRFVTIAHPISSATDGQLAAAARVAAADIATLFTSNDTPGDHP